MPQNKRILLIISGGIAAYKCLEVVRLLREQGAAVRCILTKSATEFITPLSVASLSGDKVYGDLFSLTDEYEMGHIKLSRDADLIVVVPATANILARMAQGIADDLATTVLLATDKKVMAAPSMNVRMWEHAATISNIETLRERGIEILGPNCGDMACGEYGEGRMIEPKEILTAVQSHFSDKSRLNGLNALVTSGPTHEAIDPVRYIANRSSGKQGHAIASALVNLGAKTTLVRGPTNEPDPNGAKVIRVETACEMLKACKAALPADIAICAAAVSDWRIKNEASHKIKKENAELSLSLEENPDILKILSQPGNGRPRLVVGFAAETGDVAEKSVAKRVRKGCDWIIGNDVSPKSGTFGGDTNQVHLVTETESESWPKMSKQEVANLLVNRIADQIRPLAITE